MMVKHSISYMAAPVCQAPSAAEQVSLQGVVTQVNAVEDCSSWEQAREPEYPAHLASRLHLPTLYSAAVRGCCCCYMSPGTVNCTLQCVARLSLVHAMGAVSCTV